MKVRVKPSPLMFVPSKIFTAIGMLKASFVVIRTG